MSEAYVVISACPVDPDRSIVRSAFVYYPSLKMHVGMSTGKELGSKSFSLHFEHDPLMRREALMMARPESERASMLRIPVLANLVDTPIPFRSEQSTLITTLVLRHENQAKVCTVELDSSDHSIRLSSEMLQRQPANLSRLTAMAFLSDAIVERWRLLKGTELDMCWQTPDQGGPTEMRLSIRRTARAMLGLTSDPGPQLSDPDIVAVRPLH